MSEAKMRWTRPQLIVLSRGTPEESVLLHCKRIGGDAVSTAPENQGQNGCDNPAAGKNCGACRARATS